MLRRRLCTLLVFALLSATSSAYGQAKPKELPKLKEIKPGWNLFSKDQDVQMGKEYSQEIEKQVEVLGKGPLQDYIAELGAKLAARPEANGFPYVFKAVNDPTINAFALPGGPIYIHTGILLNADNEGQLMGVMAHEVGHVALRHSTNQVTKSYALQIPAMVLGAYGQSRGGLTGMLTQLGVGLGANGILMKFSRGAEQQADLLGTRMMAQIGYNPLEMARFFEKLEAVAGKGGPEFFSSHPNPGNRAKYVSEEITKLPQRSFNADSGKFERMKMLAKNLPAPKKKPQAGAGGGQAPPQPPQNSDGSRTWTGDGFRMQYPGDWTAYGQANGPSVTIAPANGVIQGSNGQAQIGIGVIVSHYEDEDGKHEFRADTEKLISQIMQQNPSMGRNRPQINQNQVNGRTVYVTRLTSQSPIEGNEIDTVVTLEHRGGLLYMVFIAPERQMNQLQGNFDRILTSLTLN